MYNAAPTFTLTLDAARELLIERPDLLARLACWAGPDPVRVMNPGDVARIVTPLIGAADVENLVVVTLDARSRVLGTTVLTIGSAEHTVFPIAGILRHVLTYPTARAFVVSHNHPSGDSTPSREDIAVTDRLRDACSVVGLALHDHVIVTSGGTWTSLASSGYLS